MESTISKIIARLLYGKDIDENGNAGDETHCVVKDASKRLEVSDSKLRDAITENENLFSREEMMDQQKVLMLLDKGIICAEEASLLFRRVFTRYALAHGFRSSYGYDLLDLFGCLNRHPEYMDAIDKKGLRARREIASICFASMGLGLSEEDAQGFRSREMSAAIRRTLDEEDGFAYTKPADYFYEYFVSALSLCSEMPEELCSFANLDKGTRCAMTQRITFLNKAIKDWDWVDQDVRRRYAVYAKCILDSIIDQSPDDLVAATVLGHVLEDAGDYLGAREAFRKALDMQVTAGCSPDDICHKRMSLINTLLSERKHLLKTHASIRERQNLEWEIRREFDSLIGYAQEQGRDADGYIQSYARFEKSGKHFNKADDLLGQMAEGYRKHLDQAMLFSSPDAPQYGQAQYCDYEKALGLYQRAWGDIGGEANKDSIKKISILYPLANTLKNMGRNQDALDICTYGLSFRKEPKLISIKESLLSDYDLESRQGFPQVLAVAV